LSSREERYGFESGLGRRAAMIAAVAGLVALGVGAFFGDRGVFHLMQQKERAAALRGEIEELRSENARLAGEIGALRRNPLAIERLAREQLGLARPGETVFLVHDETRR
jgi:cell division protein FtsB